MPSLIPHHLPPLVGDSGYDIQAGVSAAFLNRALAQALASGALPSRFATGNQITDPSLGVTIKYELRCHVLKASVFSEVQQDRRIGVRLEYAGTISSDFVLDEWKFSSPAGDYVDPALNEHFEVTFSGVLEATGEIRLSVIDGANIVSLRFAELLRADINEIGDVHFGREVNELLRRMFERVGVVRLRTTFSFPRLGGLSGSLPGPSKYLFGSASGEVGIIDVKVVGAEATVPDEIHLLLQAQQNLGQQRYEDVEAFTKDAFDVGLAVSYRWIRQILQDLWIGGAIPHQFNDKGQPDRTGRIHVSRLGLTCLNGTLQVRATIDRQPFQVAATLEVRPHFQSGVLYVDLVSSDIDLSFDWAVRTGWSIVFFAVRDVVGSLVLRGVNELLEPWTQALLERFIEGRGIDLRRRFAWSGTPFVAELSPVVLDWTPTRVLLGTNLQLIQ